MEIYEASRKVPDEAKKIIGGGKLKGFTDINPMWRIKKLTELFGPCGIGWKYTIDRQWLEPYEDGTVAAFCNVSLFIKADGQWSDAIPGTGGSMMVAKDKNMAVSDECFKMALTDALSVACKALGFGADVYWDKDRTKYSATQAAPDAKQFDGGEKIDEIHIITIRQLLKQAGKNEQSMIEWLNKEKGFNVQRIEDMTAEQGAQVCHLLRKK